MSSTIGSRKAREEERKGASKCWSVSLVHTSSAAVMPATMACCMRIDRLLMPESVLLFSPQERAAALPATACWCSPCNSVLLFSPHQSAAVLPASECCCSPRNSVLLFTLHQRAAILPASVVVLPLFRRRQLHVSFVLCPAPHKLLYFP